MLHLNLRNAIFQQDNDPNHIAKVSFNWVQLYFTCFQTIYSFYICLITSTMHLTRYLTDPPKVLTLTPLSMRGNSLMTNSSASSVKPTSESDIMEKLQSAWFEITSKEIRNLIDSCQDVVKLSSTPRVSTRIFVVLCITNFTRFYKWCFFYII